MYCVYIVFVSGARCSDVLLVCKFLKMGILRYSVVSCDTDSGSVRLSYWPLLHKRLVPTHPGG